jgi:hypothetical protein
MKSLMLALVCFGLSFSTAQADHVTPKQASARIKRVVEAFEPLAWSGVTHYKVKAGLSVRATLEAIAKKLGHEEFTWATEEKDAWEADSTLWGWTNLRGARSYLTTIEDAFWEVAGENGKREKLEAQFEKAKLELSKFDHTGVTFGIAPLGATQCGIQFAALVVIDSRTGNVWVVAMEGSGC